MEDRPDSQQAMMDQGFEKLRVGRFEDAIDAFTACLAVFPDASKAVLGRAIARFQIKSWKAAEQDFRRAGVLDPQEPECRVGVAVSLAMQNKIYPAIEVLEKLIADFPNFVRAYIQLATLNIKIGAISKGKEYLRLGLEHRPSLEERQSIESSLNEQTQLDSKRYYRPDFEALNKREKNDSLGD